MPCTACTLKTAFLAAALPIGVALMVTGVDATPPRESATPEAMEVGASVLHHSFDMIDGSDGSMAAFEGKVVLIVNTASRCGLTPQYEKLESFYREHQDAGLVVLGFPANNFMGQEPGTNEEIAQFCSERYEVTFPMGAKISVKGDDAHPLYQQLAALPSPVGGEPSWNFTKYLVDRSGDVVARFDPRITPDDPEFARRVTELLGDQP